MRTVIVCAALLVGCSAAPGSETNEESSPSEGLDGVEKTFPTNGTQIVADLRADTNRDGVISFDDPTDDTGEDDWNAQHGAVFLANIDDDEVECPTDVDDVELPNCNDATDEIVNGPDDALDLARLETRPWPVAPSDATAKITFTNPSKVRLFKVANGQYTPIQSGHALTLNEIKYGIELAIEGRDIVRDPAVWNGYVDVRLDVKGDGGKTGTDVVRMRVSPLMTYHHGLTAETTWVSAFNATGNIAMRNDLAAACAEAGVPGPRTINTTDSWAQDYFETGFMSMPGPNGTQRVIRVNIRSANEHNPQNVYNPLRQAGRVVFYLRGKDTAAIQEYDPTRNGKHDTLNSFGNFETIPPFTYGGQTYPLGRVLRGKTETFSPDKNFLRMIESQKVQPPLYIDTSWLAVGHVDETLSFIKANSTRGWVMLVNDAAAAYDMLLSASNSGYGNTPMFVGKWWDQSSPAQVTIDQVLSDQDVMGASDEAVVEVDGQVAAIKAATGLTNVEIVKIPFLHMHSGQYSIAYQPGMVNGIYIADKHFVAPDPHGPVINGKDIFKTAMTNALSPYGVTVHFAEDWDTYHRNMGEVHCGSNATRQIPAAKWWESGR